MHGFSPLTTESVRLLMVDKQIAGRGVRDPLVLAAMCKVPRHEFVPTLSFEDAYADCPLPIGYDQTISQPYIVGFMIEAAGVKPGSRVLEVGTGCGYQAAVLAEITDEVYSIEIIEPLAGAAKATLEGLRYSGVHLRCGDGYVGWPEAAPFDAILLAAAPDRVPQRVLDQLAEGGRLVAPVGGRAQELVRVTKGGGKLKEESLMSVRFVPMTGRSETRS